MAVMKLKEQTVQLFQAGEAGSCQKEGGCLAIRPDLVLEDEEIVKKTPYVPLPSECI